MFRSVADVVLKDDLRGYLTLPRIRGGQRQLVTSPPSDAFRAYQKYLGQRIEVIRQRKGRPRPVQRGANRRWITLQSGGGSRSKSAPRHA